VRQIAKWMNEWEVVAFCLVQQYIL
jgi:hypothetical protein